MVEQDVGDEALLSKQLSGAEVDLLEGGLERGVDGGEDGDVLGLSERLHQVGGLRAEGTRVLA